MLYAPLAEGKQNEGVRGKWGGGSKEQVGAVFFF